MSEATKVERAERGSTAAGLGALSSAVNIGASLVRSKATALWLGASGLGLGAEVTQVATLCMTPVGLLFGPAFVRRFGSSETDSHRNALVASTFRLAAGLGAVAVLLTLPLTVVLGPTGPAAAPRLVLLLASFAAVTALLQAGQQGLQQVLVARGSLRDLATLSIACTSGLSAGVAVGTIAGGIRGQFVGSTIGLALSLGLWLGIKRPAKGSAPSIAYPDEHRRTYVLESFQTGATTLLTGLALQLALVAIRTRLDATAGLAAVGQFQASWAISTTYFGVLLSGTTAYAFPRFATAPKDQLLDELEPMVHLMLRLAPPVILLAIGAKRVILSALYSDAFQQASTVLSVQLAADLAKGVSWMFGGALIYRGRLRAFAFTELFAALLIGGVTSSLIGVYGLEATGWGVLVSYLLYLPLTAFTLGYVEGVRIPRQWVVLPLVGSLLLLLLGQLSEHWSVLNVPVVLLGAVGVLVAPLPGPLGRARGKLLSAIRAPWRASL